ncbi:hypothetical protein METHP14_80051 [Pseudomonas sp. P14-2025]
MQVGEAEHGGDAAETRHFVAAQWLVESLVHGGPHQSVDCCVCSNLCRRAPFTCGLPAGRDISAKSAQASAGEESLPTNT